MTGRDRTPNDDLLPDGCRLARERMARGAEALPPAEFPIAPADAVQETSTPAQVPAAAHSHNTLEKRHRRIGTHMGCLLSLKLPIPPQPHVPSKNRSSSQIITMTATAVARVCCTDHGRRPAHFSSKLIATQNGAATVLSFRLM